MRPEDEQILKENIDYIKEKAEEIYINNFAQPSVEEYTKVKNIIIKFIRERNRIVYGGYAQNELIKKKNIDDDFYGDTRADIEIYSPEPIKDLIDILHILKENNIPYLKGDEGVHPETYKVFANFENYCDISYMNKHIYNNLPTINVKGMRMTHPHFMYVDAFRVYTDPMTSYFRLDKTYNRFSRLIRHYPIPKSNKGLTYNISKENLDILEFIRKSIIMDSKNIVIGHYGVDFLVRKVDIEQIKNKYPYYQLLTTDIEKEGQRIYNLLKAKYKNVNVLELSKFFMFLDRCLVFIVDNNVVLKLYGNNDRCIVNQYSNKKNTYFGTFQLIYLHLLIDYNYHIINKDKVEIDNYLYLLNLIEKARDTYLSFNEKTILDDTNFKHFTFDCYGKPVDPIRDSRLRGLKRLERGESFRFSYVPKETKGKYPNFKFENTSGNSQKSVNLIRL